MVSLAMEVSEWSDQLMKLYQARELSRALVISNRNGPIDWIRRDHHMPVMIGGGVAYASEK